MKLQDLFAQVGGFINAILFIFRISVKLIQNVDTKIVIIKIFLMLKIFFNKKSKFEKIV